MLRCQVYGLRGVLDMSTPPWWREKVMVYYCMFETLFEATKGSFYFLT